MVKDQPDFDELATILNENAIVKQSSDTTMQWRFMEP